MWWPAWNSQLEALAWTTGHEFTHNCSRAKGEKMPSLISPWWKVEQRSEILSLLRLFYCCLTDSCLSAGTYLETVWDLVNGRWSSRETEQVFRKKMCLWTRYFKNKVQEDTALKYSVNEVNFKSTSLRKNQKSSIRICGSQVFRDSLVAVIN